MAEFVVLSGESYDVEADSQEEAEEKAVAFIMGDPCPCGEDEDGSLDCGCVTIGETLTMCVD